MRLLVAILLLLSFFSCNRIEKGSSDLIDFIPRKASVIIKTNNLEQLISDTKNHALLSKYAPSNYGAKLNEYGDVLQHFSTDQESLIAFTQIGKNDYEISYITKSTPALFTPDSLKYTLRDIHTTDPQITEVIFEETSFYTVTIGNTFLASSSQLLLENTIREKENFYDNEKGFLKAYNSSNNKAIASVLVKGSEASALWQTVVPKTRRNGFKDAYSWLQADIDLSQNDLKLNGVVLVQDSTNQYLELLKNTQPLRNKVAQITPLGAKGAVSLSYDNWEVFKNNHAEYKKIDPSKFTIDKDELLSSFQEIGLISIAEGDAVAAISLDTESTNLALSSEQEISSTFRQVAIFGLSDDGFKNAFAKAYSQILQLPKVSYYCNLDDFYLFADKKEALENIIANYQNKATYSANEAYQNTASQLSRASSLLYLSSTAKIDFEKLVSDKEAAKMKAVSLEDYPFAAVQLIQDNGFMHFQSVINKNENPLQKGAVAQIASTKLDEAIMLAPKLVKNHRTKGMDIVLQDQTNDLYLLSNAGKILWKKSLNSPILGEIQQVDLYRNGRLQLAFATENTFYILDRNGKEVAPFPIKFKGEITQPLSIFDYDKNRNYRFVITQSDKVTMYDKAAKKVTGFTFNKAANEIVLPPQHLRIGNKDYITIAEKNGTLNILSRTGKPRIEVAEKMNFSEAILHKKGSNFTTYDVNGEKLIITPQGKVIAEATDYGSGSTIVTNDKVTTSIRDNILYINSKKITLPFGSYTTPTVTKVKNKTYISSTNTESSQTYVYDEKGALLDNFPIYGASQSAIGNLERDKSLGLVTQGDAKTVLVYRIN